MTELVRRFGFWTGWFVVAASMVGSGILTNSGPILIATQSYPALFLLWGIGGLLAMLGALTLGELASGLPHVGGDYTFVREAFGPASGFVYGWSMVILGFGAPIALVSFTTANYLYPSVARLALVLGRDIPLGETLFLKGFASLLILTFSALHCWSHRSSALVQAATTFFKLVVMLGFALVGMWGKGSWTHLAMGVPLATVPGPAYATGLILILYAYTGWNAATYLAGEIHRPKKLLPLCLIAGCLAVTLLYLVVNLFYGHALGMDDIRSLSSTDVARLAEVAVSAALGKNWAELFSFLVSLGVLASLSAYILTGPRIVYAMAQDRLFPAFAGKLHPATGVPVFATLAQAVFAMIFLWSGTFEQVLTVAGFGLALLGMFVVAPIFILRRRETFCPEFRTPFYPWTPVMFLVVSFICLVGSALDSPLLALASLGSILLAYPLYFFLDRLNRFPH